MSNSETESSPGKLFQPLLGVRITDFSSNMAGPYATMILAQLGADVIKVEPPAGDDARAWPPMANGLGIAFRHMSTGKRGIVIDLKLPAGVEVALALIGRSDVVLQSMRPGVADRIGIGSAVAHLANPDVLYYDLNAFGSGQVGQTLPGYDPLVQAFSGLMEMTGHDDSPPTRCAPSLVDLGTGQWIAMGVLAATLARRSGHPVGRLETALVDTAFSVIPYQASTAKLTGERPPRAGSGNPIAAPYQCYRARDADILIAAPSQRLWESVVNALAAPALADDSRFITVAERCAHRPALEVALNELLAKRDVDYWIDRFTQCGVPVARVSGLEQAVGSDVATERGTFLDSAGVPLVRLPWLVDGKPVAWKRDAPQLGEHTIEILRDLGFDDDQTDELIKTGAVVAAT
ncbi:MAG: crotonobetainyl-CoA:carnitine CoA-transferase CaiB-like acyl-CoA transferase [Gammaproteobacteria bacterium]|jgi:crotonobetainyl-CoA:carnitine CoA-transferase CaiB-like acyl-CoA transferase